MGSVDDRVRILNPHADPLLLRLDRHGLLAVLRRRQIVALVDATHPFVSEAHGEARAAAEQAGIPDLRYEHRFLDAQLLSLWSSTLLHWVHDDVRAADLAASLGGGVFLTTGSKKVSVYCGRLRSSPHSRLIVRLLPTVENLQQCGALGVDQADIVALQGPLVPSAAKLSRCSRPCLSVHTKIEFTRRKARCQYLYDR